MVPGPPGPGRRELTAPALRFTVTPMRELTVDADSVQVTKHQNLDGGEAILAMFTVTESELREHFALDPTNGDDSPVVYPLRKNWEGTTNFEKLVEDDGEVRIEMTDEQFRSLRDRFSVMLQQ